jgi:hypothetical protein
MRILTIAVVSGLGLLASPLAFADQPATPTPVSTTSTQSEPLVCHALYHEGSVVHKGVCLTQREWDRIRFEQQQELRNFQQRSLTQSGM